MKPTEEQLKWFLEQCGFEHRYLNIWLFPDGTYGKVPDIDSLEFLGFMFKYAVPKWIESFPHGGGRQVAYRMFSPLFETLSKQDYQKDLFNLGKEFAIALFWAIYKGLGGKE